MKDRLERLPETYLQQSRDFQFFARLWNVVAIGMQYRAKSLLNVLDPLRCPEDYLDALRDRLGFEPTIHIDTRDMRLILKAFPYLIKHKGSRKAIVAATRLALVIQGLNPSELVIQVDTKEAEIQVLTDVEIDTAILGELFRHIAPVGFKFRTSLITVTEGETDIKGESEVREIEKPAKELGSMREKGDGMNAFTEYVPLGELKRGETETEEDPTKKSKYLDIKGLATIGDLEEWARGSMGTYIGKEVKEDEDD